MGQPPRFDSRKLRVLRGGAKSVRDVPGLKCQGCPRPFRAVASFREKIEY
jgi:hypothetical protein